MKHLKSVKLLAAVMAAIFAISACGESTPNQTGSKADTAKADSSVAKVSTVKSDNTDSKEKVECTLSEYLSQTRFKMRLQRRERDRTGKAEIARDRANLTETILRVCDSNNEKNGQNFISIFEMMKNKRIIG